MSVLTDTASYPIAPATARHLGRPLFGHVIDGEVVPSLDGASMPVTDPATGERVATAAAGSAADVGAGGGWTRDLARAHRASRALRVGTVWGNTYQMVYPSGPYGGVKASRHRRVIR